MKKVLALQCQGAGPSGWPWKWTCNLWWLGGFFFCLIPLRGGKVEARKQGNKYFLMEKAWCLKPTSDSRDHISSSWEGIVDWLLWMGSFALYQKGWRVSKCFLLRMRRQRITFFGHTKQKLKTIEVVFIYSKRSTGFWYCERCQGPEKTNGTQTVIKTCSVFFFSNIFQSLSKFQERTSGTVTVRNSKVLSF